MRNLPTPIVVQLSQVFYDRLERRFSQLEAMLERRLGEQTRWLYVSWATLMAAIIALWFRR